MAVPALPRDSLTPTLSQGRGSLALSGLAALACWASRCRGLVTRRFWQFDLDDGLRAAAMVGVLVAGWTSGS